jgi:hypothetical protein
MLAVSSDSNLTVVGSRSVTSGLDSIVTEADLGQWSSNLGKFPKSRKNFVPIVKKSIVPIPIVKLPIVIPTIVITQHFHTELLKCTGTPASVTPIIAPNCLTFAETVKRTYLVAKKANRQSNAMKTSSHSNLFSSGFKMGPRVHQLDNFDLPIIKMQTLCIPVNKTIVPSLIDPINNCDVINKNTIEKTMNNDTNLNHTSIVTDVPENPRKRRAISIRDQLDAGPSSEHDRTPFVIPRRAKRVPSWARIDDETATARGSAPDIPELAMPLYRTLRNAESKKAKSEVSHDFVQKYQTGKITPKSFMIDVIPPIGREDDDFMNQWYSVIATAESSLNALITERAFLSMSSHDVTIVEARATLARVLTTDNQICEATRAINSVTEKVRRKERLAREDKLWKDKIANRERYNKRRGLPVQDTVVRPSEKSFPQRGPPKQGQTSKKQMKQSNRPSGRDSNAPQAAQKRGPGRDRDERTPRPRAKDQSQKQEKRPLNQNRNVPSLKPDQTEQIEKFMREIKKLMRK